LNLEKASLNRLIIDRANPLCVGNRQVRFAKLSTSQYVTVKHAVVRVSLKFITVDPHKAKSAAALKVATKLIEPAEQAAA